MTEPDVASSDARNIQTSIVRDGDEYVINGRKWWTSGAADERCQIFIVMGKTDPDGAPHRQQSMILVPRDTPGLEIIRHLPVFGYQDQHGHSELRFTDVRVPAANILAGEGDGFMIAQARLGPGRIHHCMRAIGMAERALALMVERTKTRVAFGRPLAEQGTVREAIALSRIEIDQARLYVLQDRGPDRQVRGEGRPHRDLRDQGGRAARWPSTSSTARSRCTAAPASATTPPLARFYATPARCGSSTAPTRCTSAVSPRRSWPGSAPTAADPSGRERLPTPAASLAMSWSVEAGLERVAVAVGVDPVRQRLHLRVSLSPWVAASAPAPACRAPPLLRPPHLGRRVQERATDPGQAAHATAAPRRGATPDQPTPAAPLPNQETDDTSRTRATPSTRRPTSRSRRALREPGTAGWPCRPACQGRAGHRRQAMTISSRSSPGATRMAPGQPADLLVAQARGRSRRPPCPRGR